MQNSELDNITTSLMTYFPIVSFVERKEEGFIEATRFAYVRNDSQEGDEFRVEEDWIIGTYVAVAQSDESQLLNRLWSLVESGGGEVTAGSRNSEIIYEDETGQKLQRVLNVARVLFTVRTESVCISC